ncbi:MAG: GGDEF domain-containing protein [Ferrimonas sp.]
MFIQFHFSHENRRFSIDAAGEFGSRWSAQSWRGLLAVALGLGAYAINLHPLPFLDGVGLPLGNALIMLLVSRVSGILVVPAAAVASLGWHQVLASNWLGLLFVAEAVVVGHGRRRGHLLLWTDLLFWLLLGVPLGFLLLITLPGVQAAPIFHAIQLGFIGVFCCALACLFLGLAKPSWLQEISSQPVLKLDFKRQVGSRVMALLTVLAMVVVLGYSHYALRAQQEWAQERLQISRARVELELERYVQQAQQELRLIGDQLPLEPVQQASLLAQLQERSATFSFITSLDLQDKGSDGDGWIAPPQLRPSALFVAPTLLAHESMDIGQMLAVDNMKSAMAEPAITADGPQLPWLIIALPWPTLEAKAPFCTPPCADRWLLGRIELSAVIRYLTIAPEMLFLVTDEQAGVRLSSAQFEFDKGQPLRFPLNDEGNPATMALPISMQAGMMPPESSRVLTQYYRASLPLMDDWQLHLLWPAAAIAERAQKQFLLGVLLLFGCALITAFALQQFIELITQPLEQLVQHDAQRGKSMRLFPAWTATEIQQLQQALQRQQQLLFGQQAHLEHEVVKRTAELANANRQLACMAAQDGLTGAVNRHQLAKLFEQQRQYGLRTEQPLLLVLLDIDHFKRINDQHGHLVGDACLKSLVRFIKGLFSRENDVIARYGGEEFVLLLGHQTAMTVATTLERLRSEISQAPMTLLADKSPLFFTVSIGALWAPASFSRELSAWLAVADGALYQAKNAGRNRVELKSHWPETLVVTDKVSPETLPNLE